MNRLSASLVLLGLMQTAAHAQPAPAAASDPAQQALSQMISEAMGREAQALAQIYALRAQVAVEKKRADEAEAKLKPAEPAPQQ